jgi:NAD(P) transhydrogenase subunit alpha
VLIPQGAVAAMRPGSVIVDLAAERGGNCELTEPGRIIEKNQVTIIGETNLASHLPVNASEMYSRNLISLLGEILVDGQVVIDFNNEIVAGACISHQGRVLGNA